MKTFNYYLFKYVIAPTLFVMGTYPSMAQTLTELTGIRIYEHHSSITVPFGSQSAYDFVNHTYIVSTPPMGQPNDPDYVDEKPNRDLVEMGGPFAAPNKFGWTSGISDIWSGDIYGNGLTTYLKDNDFSYDETNANNIHAAFDEANATQTIDEPEVGDIYLVKIRNTPAYALMKITEWVYDDANALYYFQFDYKYGSMTTGIGKAPANPGLAIYPNPANGFLQVDCPENNCKTLELFSMDGKLAFQKDFNAINDVSTVQEGTYLLSVKDENGRQLTLKKVLIH